MQGKIIKGIAGFYYVHVEGFGVYECKAKGAFRNKKVKPLVGDNVEIEILDESKKKGNIIDILPRHNALIRPAVSNIDQALIIFAATQPEPNLNLLDRFLIMMEKQGVKTIICFNKEDLADEALMKRLRGIYEKTPYQVCSISVLENEGIQELQTLLKGKTTVLAGPSGVGKSSLLNLLYPEAEMETGDISQKVQRGKHTTRHSQIFHVDVETYIFDTPGFTSLYLEQMEAEELKQYYLEFEAYEDYCRFGGCNHISEPGCGVKEALEEKKISQDRYDNYVLLYNELKSQKKY